MKFTNRLIVEREESDPTPEEFASACRGRGACPFGQLAALCPFQNTPCSEVQEDMWKQLFKKKQTSVTFDSIRLKRL